MANQVISMKYLLHVASNLQKKSQKNLRSMKNVLDNVSNKLKNLWS